MRKITFSLIAFLYLLTQHSFGNYCWVQRSNAGLANRYAAMGFSIGTKGYVVCGNNGPGRDDLWEYESTTNLWTQKASYPGGLIWAGAAFTVGNLGYVTTGTLGFVFPTNTYEYNPLTNTWTQKASLPANGRQDNWGFGIGNFGYIVGGWNVTYYGDTWRFDPATNTWAQMAQFGGGNISGIRGFVIGNTAYVVGGLSSSTSGSNQVWAYEPSTNSWSSKANFPGTGRHSTCCFEMNGKGIAGGGFNGTTGYADFYEYTPSTNSWLPITPYNLNRPLGYPVCFTIGSNGYIASGKNGNAVNSNNTWMLINGNTAQINFTTNACGDIYNFSTTATGVSSYNWDFGDGSTSTNANPSHQYSNFGPYTVTLTVTLGFCSSIITQNINVSSQPNALFTYSLDTCQKTITFQNNSTNSGSYVWDFGDGQTSTSTAPTHTYSGTGPYNVKLLAIAAGNPNCMDSTFTTITFPSAVLSANATLQPDCNNGINISNFTTNATSYSWIWGDGNITNGTANSYQYSTNGNYTIQLALQEGNCHDTINFPVSIATGPTASFTASSNCDLSSNVLNQSTPGANLQWNWGDNTTNTGIQTTHSYNQPGPYTITLIAIQGNCSDTTTQNLTIYTPALSQFSLTPDCSNGISINNTSQGGISETWSWGDGNSSSGTSTYYAYSTSGNYIVSLITQNNNCSDTSYQNITVQTTPLALIGSQYTLCHDSIFIWSTNGANSYNWTLDNNFLSTDSSTTITASSPFSLPLTLIASNGICSDTSSITLQIAGLANADFTATIGCDGEVTATPLTSNLSNYQWYNGIGNIFNTEKLEFTYTTAGNYTIQLNVSNGYCTDSSTFNFSIGNPVNYTIDYSLDSCSRTIFASVSPDTSVNIIWNFGDGIVLFGNPIQHQFASSQEFNNHVYIDTTSNCGDTIPFFVDLTSINYGEDAFIPNCFTPNNDSKNDYFEIGNEICNFLAIKIYNRWGEVVFESTDKNFKWDGTYKGSPLPEGIYLYILSSTTDDVTGTLNILR